MRRGVRGDLAHRLACAECGQRVNRYLQRRRTVGLSPAEQRVVDRAWARLTDLEVFQYKARALLMGHAAMPPTHHEPSA